jgi:hypothetical protein
LPSLISKIEWKRLGRVETDGQSQAQKQQPGQNQEVTMYSQNAIYKEVMDGLIGFRHNIELAVYSCTQKIESV